MMKILSTIIIGLILAGLNANANECVDLSGTYLFKSVAANCKGSTEASIANFDDKHAIEFHRPWGFPIAIADSNTEIKLVQKECESLSIIGNTKIFEPILSDYPRNFVGGSRDILNINMNHDGSQATFSSRGISGKDSSKQPGSYWYIYKTKFAKDEDGNLTYRYQWINCNNRILFGGWDCSSPGQISADFQCTFPRVR